MSDYKTYSSCHFHVILNLLFRLHPNAKMKMLDTGEIVLVALTRIDPGTEVTYDYGEKRPNKLKEMPWLKL